MTNTAPGREQPRPAGALHRALGFREAGRLERIGFKHGRWLDVAWPH